MPAKKAAKKAANQSKQVANEGPRTARIRDLRERSRLTQEEVSVLTGLDVTTISKQETGSRGVDEEAVRLYSRVFKCASYELFVAPEVEDTYNDRSWALYLPGSTGR